MQEVSRHVRTEVKRFFSTHCPNQFADATFDFMTSGRGPGPKSP